jgi:hypothetical protein
VPGDGRWVVNNDHPSHFNLTTFTQWKDYAMTDRVKTRIMLHGMTKKAPEELVPLARSWLYAPALETQSGQARYETAERAYVIVGVENTGMDAMLMASQDHPAINPAFVLSNLRWENPKVQINGKPLTPSTDFQHGTVMELEQWKTIIWIQSEFTQNVRIDISR